MRKRRVEAATRPTHSRRPNASSAKRDQPASGAQREKRQQKSSKKSTSPRLLIFCGSKRHVRWAARHAKKAAVVPRRTTVNKKEIGERVGSPLFAFACCSSRPPSKSAVDAHAGEMSRFSTRNADDDGLQAAFRRRSAAAAALASKSLASSPVGLHDRVGVRVT